MLILYLDIISPGEDLVYETNTIFDIFNSYNYLEQSDALNCYINIYFDIGEVFRRKLVEKIEQSNKSLKEIQFIYEQTNNEMNDQHNLFRKEAFAGRNVTKLEEWNAYILNELGINNFELIGFNLNRDDLRQK